MDTRNRGSTLAALPDIELNQRRYIQIGSVFWASIVVFIFKNNQTIPTSYFYFYSKTSQHSAFISNLIFDVRAIVSLSSGAIQVEFN